MEQETETKIVQQNKVTNGFDETPAQSGCLETLVALLVATLGAFVIGVGICVGGFSVGKSVPDDFSFMFNATWIGSLFIIPIIVFILILKNF